MDPQTPVNQVAAGHPRIWRVLERFGIDYCCGGRQPLEAACALRGIPVAQVLDEVARVLDGPNSGPDLTRLRLTELADYVERMHHDYLKCELPNLRARLGRVAQVHGAAHPEVLELREIFAEFADQMESHMVKEEQALFPAIREMERSGRPLPLDGPVDRMLLEHQAAEQALVQMRKLTGSFTAPPDACSTFKALYHGLAELDRDMLRHVHIENNILFPGALRG